MNRKFPVVLVIDDSQAFRTFSKDVIKRTVKWVRVIEAKNGVEGLKLYQSNKPDLILLDVKMPDLDGFHVLKYIKNHDSRTKIIMTTAFHDDQDSINELMKLGAYSFVPKPMNRLTLMKTITDVLYSGKIAGTTNQMSKSVVLSQN